MEINQLMREYKWTQRKRHLLITNVIMLNLIIIKHIYSIFYLHYKPIH